MGRGQKGAVGLGGDHCPVTVNNCCGLSAQKEGQ